MNTKFKNLIPGKLYQVLDIEGGEMDLTPISSTEQFPTFEAPRGSIVMFIEVIPPKTPPFTDAYYRIVFMYKSSVGYFEFGNESGWHQELLTYEQYKP